MHDEKSQNKEEMEIKHSILQGENTRMQNKILVLCQELDLQICKSDKLQEALQETTKYAKNYK